MNDTTIFLASSKELKAERDAFEIMIRRKNKDWWYNSKPYLNLEIWEEGSEALPIIRTQDHYNDLVNRADIFILLVCENLGKYSYEEFGIAKESFLKKGTPLVFVYKKDSVQLSPALAGFIDYLQFEGQEYFFGNYNNFTELELKVARELDIFFKKKYITRELETPDPDKLALLLGLGKRYRRLLKGKMHDEQRFLVKLDLDYVKPGMDTEHAKYFIDTYEDDQTFEISKLLSEFDRKIKRLMITGDAGAGKSVLLLTLAVVLIERARSISNYPIPVILNLSTWQNNDTSFERWLEKSLIYSAGEYGISGKYAQELMQTERFLLLLDGFDEIPASFRHSFVKEIRAYLTKAESSQAASEAYPELIITLRKNEYREQAKEIPVRALLEIKNLGEDELFTEIKRISDSGSLAASLLLSCLRQNSSLPHTLNTAFEIHIALSMIHEYNFENYSQTDLLDRYILREINKINPAKTNRNIKRLAYLSNKQAASTKTNYFELADMQDSWLNKPGKLNFFLSVISGFGLVVIMLLIAAFHLEAIVGIEVVFIATFFVGSALYNDILVNEITVISLKRVNIIYVLAQTIFYSLFGMAFIYFLNKEKFLVGLAFGFIFGLIKSIKRSLFSEKKLQNIDKPYKRLLIPVLFNTSLFFIIITIPYLLFIWQLKIKVHFFSIAGLLFAFLVISFLSSILFGPPGKHFALRILLFTERKTPLQYRKFLNRAAQTGIMEKDGGQWRFRHKLIQDRLSAY